MSFRLKFLMLSLCYFIYYAKIETIAFQCSLTNTLENIKKKIVFFDKVLWNKENAYDSTSGIFTAPSDIIYSFTLTILTKNGKYFVAEIVQNGEGVTMDFIWHPMKSLHANIKIKKGDSVDQNRGHPRVLCPWW